MMEELLAHRPESAGTAEWATLSLEVYALHVLSTAYGQISSALLRSLASYIQLLFNVFSTFLSMPLSTPALPAYSATCVQSSREFGMLYPVINDSYSDRLH